MATIDIGPGAIDGDDVSGAGYTFIDKDNPANNTGTIDTFEIWCNTNLTGTKIGTIAGSGTTYTPRDVETIGNVTSGSKQTFSGLDCDVTSGDFMGYYAGAGLIERSTSGGTQYYYKSGDQWGAGEQTYTAGSSNNKLSLYGTGVTVEVIAASRRIIIY